MVQRYLVAGLIFSRDPPDLSNAITGTPQSIAFNTTEGKGSCREVNKKTSEPAKNNEGSSS